MIEGFDHNGRMPGEFESAHDLVQNCERGFDLPLFDLGQILQCGQS